jgi:predicted nucleotidyltransferase
MSRKRSRGVEEIAPLLTVVKEYLVKTYGDKLDAIILYGSFARNDATEDSDIDIAIVLKGEVDPFGEIHRTTDLFYPLELEYGELISVNPLSKDELEDTEWPLYHHIKNEGIRM